jgi:hypothetical protein
MAIAVASALALSISLGVAKTVAQQNSEQVVFSGVAFLGSTFEKGTPAGFWIWCESDSTNPYVGECQGAMYFYALGLTKQVEGEITEIGEDRYRMDVQSSDGSISCSLTNAAAPNHGPHNVVDVTCSAPAGHATSPNAVVNVTGP